MKNIIEYFYKIEVNKLLYSNNKYNFEYKGYVYIFKECLNIPRNEVLIETQRYPMFHTIIPNFNGQIITVYENRIYILLRINIKENRKITLQDVIDVARIENKKNIKKMEWGTLWAKKIDSFEKYIMNKNNNLKYREYYDYYIGLGENAINYFNNVKDENISYGFTYNRINSEYTLYDLYDPTNIIISSIIRGISEYAKSLFFEGNEIEVEKIESLHLSHNEKILFISRMLFPTYFFDLYKENNEEKIKKIINNSSSYEKYLYYLIETLRQSNYNIPQIRWLNN